MRILFAEDDRDLNTAVKTLLMRSGYQVDAVFDGAEALEYARAESYDGMILDWMMPGLDGVEALSRMRTGERLDVLAGLGNGYDLAKAGENPLLLGGGVGVPPLVLLARRLREQGKNVTAVLGFNTKNEVFGENDFREMGCRTVVATADGSYGEKGFVTDALPESYSYFYTCGPEPMLRAVSRATVTSGELSFEERMGCGFGACMGCSCKTITGYKRICREGPVLEKEEIMWANL